MGRWRRGSFRLAEATGNAEQVPWAVRFLSHPRPIVKNQHPVVDSDAARALAMRRLEQRSWRSAAGPPERNLAGHL